MEANYIVKYSYKEQTGAYHTVQMPFNNLDEARRFKKEVESYYKTKAFLLTNCQLANNSFLSEGF